MFSMMDVQLQGNSGVSPEKSRPRKKVKKRLCGDIDQGNRVDTLKESPMGDIDKNEESPALGQAAGPSNFTSGEEQYNAELFVRQVADAELGDSTLKLVLFTIGLYADDEAICSETKTYLAEKTGLNRNVISQKIDKAASLGWLKVEFQHPKSRRSDWPVYRILMQF